MWMYAAGSTNATRCLESLPSDPQVHIRGHRAIIFATATATATTTAAAADTSTTADTAAGANPIRGTEEERRERCHGERDAVTCRAAAPIDEIGSARNAVEAILTGGDAAEPRPRLLRIDLVIGSIVGKCMFYTKTSCMKLLCPLGDKPNPEEYTAMSVLHGNEIAMAEKPEVER
jgi:hypothetical protein